MTLREKCAQMVFIEHRFEDHDPDLLSRLVHTEGIGGMVLSGGSVFDVPSFVNWAQKVAKFPLLFAANYGDGVGAQVQGATAFPPYEVIAATGSTDFAQTKARQTGLEARALGVRMVLAPSVEDPFARAAIEGFHFSKVAVCLKKFPHPDIGGLLAEADAVLVRHEAVPDLDDETVASQSRAAILGILRRELRFEGLVITDELTLLGGGVEIVEQAANAGADVLWGPSDPVAAIDGLEAAVKGGRVGGSSIDRAVTRLLLRKERMGLFADRVVDVGRVEVVVGSPSHRAAAQRMIDAVNRARGET
jgi:beta-glucosidase-like glycosyl hydrolase